MTKKDLTLELICTDLPEPTQEWALVGMQDGKQIVQDTTYAAGGKVRFTVPLQVELDEKGELVRFRGGYVQGTRPEPFLYINWGNRAGGEWVPSRRAKLMLLELPAEQIAQHAEQGTPLRVGIRMRGPKGDPIAARIKPEYIQIDS